MCQCSTTPVAPVCPWTACTCAYSAPSPTKPAALQPKVEAPQSSRTITHNVVPVYVQWVPLRVVANDSPQVRGRHLQHPAEVNTVGRHDASYWVLDGPYHSTHDGGCDLEGMGRRVQAGGHRQGGTNRREKARGYKERGGPGGERAGCTPQRLGGASELEPGNWNAVAAGRTERWVRGRQLHRTQGVRQ